MTVTSQPPDPYDADFVVSAAAAGGLLADFNGAGLLEAADVHVARRLGLLGDEADERVLLAVALTVRAVRHGSVCVDLRTVGGVGDGLPWPVVEPWMAAVASSPLVRQGVLRWDEELVYLDRYWRQELQVCDDLMARLRLPLPPVDPVRVEAGLSRLFADPRFAEQRTVAAATLNRRTSVITGGPGTGKTAMLARLIALLVDTHGEQLRIALAAPTGKAAARMAQAIHDAAGQDGFTDAERELLAGLEASTLHRLLGSRPDNRTRFRHDRANQLPHDVVVLDETSMVALPLMARLLEAVRPEARLVLVGDPDQLASVEAGAVLHDLVIGFEDAPDSPVCRLRASHRYGEAIGALAQAVRENHPDEVWRLLADGSDGLRVVDPADLSTIRSAVAAPAVAVVRAAESGDRAAAVAALSAHRVLCAHREGPAGVQHWNRQVERWLMDELGVDWLPEWYAGRPLIVNANDYGLRLWNGDTGVVCRTQDGPIAVIDDGQQPDGRSYSLSRLGDVSTAQAITVHRSQGSQFRDVTVVLPDEDSRVLSRELFYTAITRAERRVLVVATEAAVRAAVSRLADRATSLAGRLGSRLH